MHYSVLVIGHGPETQLASHCEQLTTPARHPAEERHYTELVARYGLNYTQRDAIEIAREEGYDDAALDTEKHVTLLTSYNPEGRWDWWVPGGRWAGLLPTSKAAREAARDSRLEGDDQSTLDQVLWNEDTLRLTHSLLINGQWHDLYRPEEDTEASLLEQFYTLTSDVEPDAPVLVVDCHI